MNRISLGIGDYFHDNKHDAGGTDCRLVVSNGTYNGWSTDCNIYLGTATADVRAKMRIEGDNASVRAFTCDLGRNAVIEFVPGPNGFNTIPLRIGKNFMWSAGVEQTGADNEPKMTVDVKNWTPEARKLDVELVRTAAELSTYLWETGTNAFKAVVRNAQVLNARPDEHWTVYATDDLKHIRLSFKRDRGIVIIVK